MLTSQFSNVYTTFNSFISSQTSGIRKKKIDIETILETQTHIIIHAYAHKHVTLLFGDVANINDPHTPQNYLHWKVLTSQKQ